MSRKSSDLIAYMSGGDGSPLVVVNYVTKSCCEFCG
jgi:hypothetical protein